MLEISRAKSKQAKPGDPYWVRRLKTINSLVLGAMLSLLLFFMTSLESQGQTCTADGGTLTGGPFTFNMVGDGTPDMIPAGGITVSNSQGDTSVWVVTDGNGFILGLPPMPSAVDFDTPGAGTCLVWNLSYEGMISGVALGANANDIQGCFDLSNPVEVIRENASGCQANGGVLFGGPFTFDMVGDGNPDMIPAGSITVTNNQGDTSIWVVTDGDGFILGLPPMPGAVDFDTPGAGTCLVWHLSYDGAISGVELGANAGDIQGCFSLSNPVEVIRENASGCQANGGVLFGGPFTFDMVGDGNPDMIPAGSITVTNSQGDTSVWVVTDGDGFILGLPPMPGAVDFDTPGAGTCLVWNLSYNGSISGVELGANASDIQGCFSLSNPIEVIRENASGCQANGGVLFGGPFTFDMVGDGNPDMIPAGSITVTNSQGDTSVWVVTDGDGFILGLPPMPGAVDFDTPGAGTCLVWNLSYNGSISGVELGANASDIQGCFSLSNPIEVIRENASGCQANGGVLFGGPFVFDMVGDGNPDMIPAGSITVTNSQGDTSVWVVTDGDGFILGLPPMPGAVDFDTPGAGTCLVWNLSYNGSISGVELGANASDIQGCFSLSNPIEVIRENASGCQANGGVLFGGPFVFDMVGDGNPDMIPAGSITVTNSQGDTSVWVVTDGDGFILGLPPMPGAVDFDTPGAGTCLVWNLSYNGSISGVELGANASDIQGCFSLSNPIEVIRENASGCQANGGVLFGGPFVFDMVGDGNPDMIPAGSITVTNSQGDTSVWVVTDGDGFILGLPPMPGAVDFDTPGAGTCLVWNLSYNGSISGVELGANASDIQGCFSLSNPIEVIRENASGCQANGGVLFGGPFTFDMVGDGNPDMIPAGSITVTNSQGDTSVWVVTDGDGFILGLPPMPGAVDFDTPGAGTCLVWNLSYNGSISGVELGANASDIQGCFSLSNPIEVIRENASGCQANGGVLFGGPFTFDMVGDGNPDMIPAGSITVTNSQGDTSVWVVTDGDGFILGLPPMPGAVDFDTPGAGTCLVWNLSYNGSISGVELGANASDIQGCFSLSNPVEVIRENASGCQANGGVLFGGPFVFDMVGDGNPDMIPAGSITVTNSQGDTSVWVVTDGDGFILGLPPMPGAVDFDTPGAGTCLVWNLSYNGSISGVELGANASDIQGCFSLSNPIEVIRENASGCQANGGVLFGGPFVFDMVGDGNPDMIPAGSITVTNSQGDTSVWVVTDGDGFILGLPPMPSAVDFDTPGAGTCLVWNLSYNGSISGVELGANASDIQGCFSLSNPIEVIRENASGCQANGGVLFGGPFVFDMVGDGNPDMIPAGSITVTNSQGDTSVWVVTDGDGFILGLPPMPSAVDFDTPGAGTCLVWNLSYNGSISGVELGANASDIQGCFSLSNPIEVIRENASGCQANGGVLFGGPFVFDMVGDGNPDMIPAGSITVTNSQGDTSVWVVTDGDGFILGLPPMPGAVDFDTPGAGTCLVWNLSYNGSISGVELGANASDIQGCFSLSNPIEVIRENASGCQANGGVLFGGPFVFDMVGDGNPDMIPAGSITVTNSQGDTSVWVVTDGDGFILGLPPMPGAVDFDTPGAGTCLVWNLSYNGSISGVELGANASDIQGCFSLSNPIEVIRENASGCQANGGVLFGGPFVFDMVGDGNPDMIPAGSITVTNSQGDTSVWVVTDGDGFILGLPPMPGAVDFDTPGAGTCLVWNLSYNGSISGVELGANASDIQGCFSLSNPIEVIRENASGCQANGGVLFGGPFVFDMVGDGNPDMIPAGSITVTNSQGDTSVWVVTDGDGYILGLPPMPSAVDFDNPGAGTCLVWNLSYNGSISGVELGANANDIQGCFSLSNPIEVIRENASGCQANGGVLFGSPFEFCVVDGVADTIPEGAITLTNSQGANSQWVVTDDQGVILGLPPMPSVVNFDGVEPGLCFLWHLSYEDGIVGLEVDLNANDLQGCFSLSNAIEVNRVDGGPLCTTTSTSDLGSVSSLNIFPNPATDRIEVSYEGLETNSGQLQLIDITGRVLNSRILNQANDNIEMNVANYPAGYYIIRISNNSQFSTHRFVIAK